MKTLRFATEIAAPVATVWDTMLGLETYKRWTTPFMEGSYYEGSWEEGERIRFLAPSGEGMVARIAAHRRHELISIEHLGFVKDGVEDTTSDAVRQWAPAYENYRFSEVPAGTKVEIEQDVEEGFEGFMLDTWPKALAAIAAMCATDAR